MSIPFVQGERDATIIAFPLDRVSKTTTPGPGDAVVVSLGAALMSSEGDENVSEQTEGRLPAEASEAAPSDRLRQRARNVALHALATRGVSRVEIEARLVSRELPADLVQDQISALERQGLIDDAELASNLVDKYVTRQGLGRRAAAEKMRQRGLSASVIAGALEGLSSEDESARLREVAEARVRVLGTLAPDVAKRRLVAYLQRRGYSGNEIFSVVDDVLR